MIKFGTKFKMFNCVYKVVNHCDTSNKYIVKPIGKGNYNCTYAYEAYIINNIVN